MKKISFVTGLHGNEPIPTIALASIGMSQHVANPPAIAKGVRFIDKDMNKVFGLRGNSSEEKLARILVKEIDRNNLIVDLHTCSARTIPFVILTDPKMIPLAKTLGLTHVVYMKHNIKKGHALIDFMDGVSVETGMHNTETAFKTTVMVAHNALKGKPHHIKLYEVYGIIDKPGKYINFTTYKNTFIPVLAGEKAYDFFGLKARLVDINQIS